MDRFCTVRFQDDILAPQHSKVAPPGAGWPQVSVNAALHDSALMALQQYGLCSAQLASSDGDLINVRSNHGTSIIPLLFGIELFVMDEETNTLPTSLPLHDTDAIQRIVDWGVPEIRRKHMAQVPKMGTYYTEIASQYPIIGQYVHIYHLDLQNPRDICEVIWGASIFCALYDRPDLVHALLQTVTDTYVQCLNAWIETVPFPKEGNAHWGLFLKCKTILRDDSAMNMSLEMFRVFVRPYDQQLLNTFGGRAIHFCSRGDHHAPALSEMDKLYAVNLSQPQCNDMEMVFASTIEQAIKMIGLNRQAGVETVAKGQKLYGQAHCRLNRENQEPGDRGPRVTAFSSPLQSVPTVVCLSLT